MRENWPPGANSGKALRRQMQVLIFARQIPPSVARLAGLFFRRRIRRTLAQNGLSMAVTRGDLVSGTVEVRKPSKMVHPQRIWLIMLT